VFAVPFDEIRANPGGVRPENAERRVLPAPGDGGRLELCPADVVVELAALAGEAAEEGFRYRLTCRRILHAMNSAYRNSREARRRYPVNYAWMNPDDMREAGIGEEALVEISSEFGAVRTLARSESRLRRGVVSMTHMYGPLVSSGDPMADGGANLGQLTSLSEHVQPINFMPRFSGVPVNVTLA
jgi:anaerobic selenocysteine-containing dehydrogenase